MQYDPSKYVSVELSLEEIKLIRDLLRYEASYQVAKTMKEISNPEESLVRVLTIFDNYREYDDILREFYAVITENEELDRQENTTSQKIMLMDDKMAKVYRSICKLTPQLRMTEDLKARSDRSIASIISRFDKAISDYESQSRHLEEDLKINILGIQGQA